MTSRALTLFKSALPNPKSQQTYLGYLEQFMKFIKTKDYDAVTKLDTDTIQIHLEDWVMYLIDKGQKRSSIKGKLAAAELFLEMNKVNFHRKIIRKLIPVSDSIPGGEKPYTTEDIQKFLKFTTKPRTKALVLFFTSTGARPASIVDPVLRLKHLEEMPYGCKAVTIYDGSKERYYAFLTPEAAKALEHYLNSRKLNGEELTSESPIFANLPKANQFKKNDYLSDKSAKQIMQRLIQTAGVGRSKKGSRYDKASVYGFRKRFATILKRNPNIKDNMTEKLLGHKNGLDGSYLKPTRDECFNEFLKAIPELTISDEFRQKSKIQKLEQEKSRVEKLEAKVEQLQEWFDPTLDRRIALESDPVTGEIPFDLPNIPRYALLNFKKSLKDPNYMNRILK